MLSFPFLQFIFQLVLLINSTESKKKNVERTFADFTDEEKAKIPYSGNVERTMALRTHSIYAPYVDSDLQNRWFDFGGSSIINTNKHVRLTQERSSEQGYLWSRLPITGQNFMIEVEFRVEGKGTSLFGDGWALWLTRDRASFGPVFGSRDKWEGLGIFFDTYANSRHDYTFPIVMAMSNDGTKNYNVGRDGMHQEEKHAICESEFRRTEITAKARITYVKGLFLQLDMQTRAWDQWDHCFTLWGYDLIPGPYLGFSAHTGQISDAHDIISVSSHNIVYHEDPSNPMNLPGSNFKLGDSKRGGIGGIAGVFKILGKITKGLLILVAILGVGVVGRAWWEGRKRTSKKQAKNF